MPKQSAIPDLRDVMKKKLTLREQFLAEMDAVVLLGLIAPHYPVSGPKGGRQPMPKETMWRDYFLQNRYALSDPMADETLYDSESMRRFAGIELGDDRIPDETKVLNFRELLERHWLLHGEEASVWADKGYVSAEHEVEFKAPGKVWDVMRKAPKGGELHPLDKRINRVIALVRAKIEHRFRVIKRQFGHVKTRKRPSQEPRPTLHAIRARGPVPGATEADSMRTGLPNIHETVITVA